MSVKMNPLNAAPKPKLTPAQRRVIDNLKAGLNSNAHCAQRFHGARGFYPCILALQRKGLIERDLENFRWRLTEKGKSL